MIAIIISIIALITSIVSISVVVRSNGKINRISKTTDSLNHRTKNLVRY